MKKIIVTCFAGALCSLFTINEACAKLSGCATFAAARFSNRINTVGGGIGPTDRMALLEIKETISAVKANLKVATFVGKNFKNVSGLVLHAEKKLLIATFNTSEKSARVVCTAKGSWIYSIISYGQEQLSADMRSLVQRQFKGFTISLVQEVIQKNISRYFILLEDSTSFKKMWIADAEINVYEEFQKNF